MLTSIHIKNFRSCKDVKLEGLGPLLGLVGRNAAGKTTILQAIDWVASLALASEYSLAEHERTQFALECSAGEHSFRYQVHHGARRELLEVRRDGGDWTEVFERSGRSLTLTRTAKKVAVSMKVAAIPALFALLPPEDPTNQLIAPLRDALMRVRYYPGPDQESAQEGRVTVEPSMPIARGDYERWIADLEVWRREPSILLRLLRAHEQDRERFDELMTLIGPKLGLLRDISVDYLKDQSGELQYYDVKFKPVEAHEERALSLHQLSGGTRRIVYLIAGLLFDESRVMLVEQPEDGIHPALLYKLIHLLRVNTDPTQIFFSSHSPTVLSQLRPQDVRLVAMKDGATQVRGLTDAEIRQAEEYMRREGSLAEFLELIQED